MGTVFSKSFVAGWADMDFNAHMRNTAFLDRAADVRVMYLAEHGFPASELSRMRIGPVVMKDEVDYRREVGLLQEITVTLALAGYAEDGSRFILRSDIARRDGTPCARVTSWGGWLDLTARRLVAPPQALHAAMQALAHTGDFTALPSSIRERGD